MIMLLHIFSMQSQSGCVVRLDVIPKSYKFSSHANDIHESSVPQSSTRSFYLLVSLSLPLKVSASGGV